MDSYMKITSYNILTPVWLHSCIFYTTSRTIRLIFLKIASFWCYIGLKKGKKLKMFDLAICLTSQLFWAGSKKSEIYYSIYYVNSASQRQWQFKWRRTMGKIGQFCPKIVELLTGTTAGNGTWWNLKVV